MFADRAEAGRELAAVLAGRGRPEDPVVVGLPRGGVPVAAEVADTLAAPLDVILVRKVGAPFQPELALGAIGEDGVRIVDDDLVATLRVRDEELAAVERRERRELARRVDLYRGERPRVPLEGRAVIIVDDGIATGATARAACEVARAHGASRVVLAVPVAPSDWASRLRDAADAHVAVLEPAEFAAVGQFYRDFAQVGDDEVVAALNSRR